MGSTGRREIEVDSLEFWSKQIGQQSAIGLDDEERGKKRLVAFLPPSFPSFLPTSSLPSLLFFLSVLSLFFKQGNRMQAYRL